MRMGRIRGTLSAVGVATAVLLAGCAQTSDSAAPTPVAAPSDSAVQQHLASTVSVCGLPPWTSPGTCTYTPAPGSALTFTIQSGKGGDDADQVNPAGGSGVSMSGTLGIPAGTNYTFLVTVGANGQDGQWNAWYIHGSPGGGGAYSAIAIDDGTNQGAGTPIAVAGAGGGNNFGAVGNGCIWSRTISPGALGRNCKKSGNQVTNYGWTSDIANGSDATTGGSSVCTQGAGGGTASGGGVGGAGWYHVSSAGNGGGVGVNGGSGGSGGAAGGGGYGGAGNDSGSTDNASSGGANGKSGGRGYSLAGGGGGGSGYTGGGGGAGGYVSGPTYEFGCSGAGGSSLIPVGWNAQLQLGSPSVSVKVN